MKRFLFLLSFLTISALSFAQSDTVHLSFKAKHFGLIMANSLLTNQQDADLAKVFNQVASQLVLTTDSIGRKVVADTAQLVTVVAKNETVPRMFLSMGSMQERLATNYNNEMRDLLMSVLMRRPDLLTPIQDLMAKNAAETWQLVQYGFDYLITIKE